MDTKKTTLKMHLHLIEPISKGYISVLKTQIKHIRESYRLLYFINFICSFKYKKQYSQSFLKSSTFRITFDFLSLTKPNYNEKNWV